ncbi:SDR family NAD(P)-dependent oxidoreductase [Wenjunlia tyrosinilytica]|uniref:3-oxoacyl-ACP reductase n=1 Tax=Wenjunlia tyrosinilytica TaxID=1544741 RepID=A0A917ZTD8_9ACTN|nr:SDR family oxidoreductase [Wenjunlia tyrosinilytica]GGO94255.1 3-oxoacyl-ACP reductase [Wenjunlia tyrosinilytica]
MTLAGKAVLITGAGSGIGSATAVRAARRGAAVALVGRRAEALEHTAAQVREAVGEGSRVAVLAGDVGKAPEVERVVAAAAEHFGRIDGLVNNAGTARFSALEDARIDELDTMLDTHLRGPVLLIQACLPHLRRSGGSVVNVSSVGGVLSLPGRSLYGASKAALNHLTRSLARELAPAVRVNAVLPGPVETPMYDDLGLDADGVDELREGLLSATPMGRFGRPEEIAEWVCLLLDEESSAWVTGALLPVDGGRTA